MDRKGEPKLSVKLLCVQFAFPFLSIRLCFIQKILWCPSDLQTFVQNHGSWTYYFEFYRLFFLECIFLSEYLKFVSFFTNQKAVVEWAVKFKNSLLKKVCGQWFYTKVWRSENRKRTHAGAWESNEWTKQEISLDQLVLPAQDKTRQELLMLLMLPKLSRFFRNTLIRFDMILQTCPDMS